MNKEKLVDVIEQVLTPVDEALDEELRKHLERTICNEVLNLFMAACTFVKNDYNQEYSSKASKLAYETVKPVLDDCIDRLWRSE